VVTTGRAVGPVGKESTQGVAVKMLVRGAADGHNVGARVGLGAMAGMVYRDRVAVAAGWGAMPGVV
jgi:hypothetical protein